MRTPWVAGDVDMICRQRRSGVIGGIAGCPGHCHHISQVPQDTYSYLLGPYLGDGCISEGPRKVFKLRITCCSAYPKLLAECQEAVQEVMPLNKVGCVQREGCVEVFSYSKHWICLFPQHGVGPKHQRPIVLAAWQEAMVEEHPRAFLRGLIHSDGCRVINKVKGTGKMYGYSRYHFSNTSEDIKDLFGWACDAIGVQWRVNNRMMISVARRESVALLDEFIGPKT